MSQPILIRPQASHVEAVAANLRHCFQSFAHLPGATWRDDGRVFVASTEAPIHFFNGMVGGRFGGTDAEIDAALAALQAPLRERGVAYRWWLFPDGAPADLQERLLRQGMRLMWEAPGMALDLADLAPLPPTPGLTIERIADPIALDRWLVTFAEGFQRPDADVVWWRRAFGAFGFAEDSPWQWYLGLLDGEPVATVAMLVRDGIAGIYHVVTLPQARRRGIGAAITRAPLVAAIERGATVAVLQASDEGFPVYRRLGFQQVCNLPMVAWLPPGFAG